MFGKTPVFERTRENEDLLSRFFSRIQPISSALSISISPRNLNVI
jgi:hypothetical protein